MSGSTGQIVGGVVGAVVGFYVGGPTGAQYGWAIGSTIGTIADPQKVDGPRLQDRAVQVSSYGQAISIVYGGDALAGNVIWSTDLQESATQSGGKGGPEVTSYSYSVSCAILIAEGEVLGIRRIWADAKLVYDTSPDADLATQAATEAFGEYMTFHGGTDDQLPDPTIEAALGAGNVSAYRGCCYVVFTDLPLGDYGNRIPNFRFETGLMTSQESESVTVVREPLRIYPWALNDEGRPVHSAGSVLYRAYAGIAGTLETTDWDAAVEFITDAPTHWTGIYAQTFFGYKTFSGWMDVWGPDSGGSTLDYDPEQVRYFTALLSRDQVEFAPNRSRNDWLAGNVGAYSDSMKQSGAEPNDGFVYYSKDNEYNGANAVWLTMVSDGSPGVEFATINTYPLGAPAFADGYSITWGSRMQEITGTRVPSLPPDDPGCPVGDPGALGEPAQVPGNACFCIDADGTITRNGSTTWTREDGTFAQLSTHFFLNGRLFQQALGPVLEWTDPDNNPTFWAAARAAAIADGTLDPSMTTPDIVDACARGEITAGCEPLVGGEIDTTLYAIVTDICVRAGMPSGTYDLSALSGIPVQGYTIGRQMEARAAILPLQQAFWWDFVESGQTLKAVLRGGASAVSIGADALGATEGGEPVIRVVPNRGQESELPATVTVSYPVRLAAYEPGTQRSRRVTTGSQQVIQAELAVVMPDAHAADVADVLMYTAWTNRTARQFATTRRYARYEPTDLVTLNDGEFDYVVRIVDRSEEGPIIKWTAVDERPAAYSPNSTPGPVVGDGVGGVGYDGPMRLVLIDSPILRDADDGAGHYAAAGGLIEPWTGGVAFRSYDDGANFAQVRSMDVAATMGYASTALGDFPGGNFVDELNSVVVAMTHGTPQTITRSALLNGGNAAMLGSEVIQFERAELVSTGVYRLRGLLRGRHGTEQHMGTHAVNDVFVLMTPTTVYRIADNVVDLNRAAVWKGVTYGLSLADAFEVDFTNTGAGVKPLAPAHLYAGSLGGGDYRVQWVRRTRIGGRWRDGADVPLGEVSESYLVEVLSGGSVTSSVTTSETTVDVSASPGNTVRVRQISDLVGPGFPATVTL